MKIYISSYLSPLGAHIRLQKSIFHLEHWGLNVELVISILDGSVLTDMHDTS